MRTLFLLIFIFLSLFQVRSQQDGYLKVDNGDLHYKIFGKGIPILIINGGPGMNSEGFAGLASLLSKNYEAIIYDQRGTGKSRLDRLDSTTITMDLMLKDIEALRKKLGIEEWILFGQSFGGMLASYYAANYPQRISAMVLASSGGIDMEVFDYVGENIANRLGKLESDSMAFWDKKIKDGDTGHFAKYQRARALASAYVYDKRNIPVIAERLTQGVPEVTGLVYKDLYKIKFDCKDKLKNFNKPVLIIQGRQDIVGEANAYRSHEVLRNSKMVFINECVHYGWLDQKEKFMSELNNFLAGIHPKSN